MGEFETEEQLTRTEIASYLDGLAQQLGAGGPVTLALGGRQVTLQPTDPVTLKLEGESDLADDESRAKQSIEFELVWWVDAGEHSRFEQQIEQPSRIQQRQPGYQGSQTQQSAHQPQQSMTSTPQSQQYSQPAPPHQWQQQQQYPYGQQQQYPGGYQSQSPPYERGQPEPQRQPSETHSHYQQQPRYE